MDEIAVRAVHLEHVKARLVGATRRLAPGLDKLADLGARQGARRGIAFGGGERAWRHQFPGLPIIDFRRGLERGAAFPGAQAARLPAGMAELDAWHGGMALDEFRASSEPRNEV